jgi:hypothetical protein
MHSLPLGMAAETLHREDVCSAKVRVRGEKDHRDDSDRAHGTNQPSEIRQVSTEHLGAPKLMVPISSITCGK